MSYFILLDILYSSLGIANFDYLKELPVVSVPPQQENRTLPKQNLDTNSIVPLNSQTTAYNSFTAKLSWAIISEESELDGAFSSGKDPHSRTARTSSSVRRKISPLLCSRTRSLGSKTPKVYCHSANTLFVDKIELFSY